MGRVQMDMSGRREGKKSKPCQAVVSQLTSKSQRNEGTESKKQSTVHVPCIHEEGAAKERKYSHSPA